MELRILFLVFLFSTVYCQNYRTNTIDDSDVFGKEPDIGGFVNSLLQSEEGKQLGSILVNAAVSGSAGNILSGLGSMLGGDAGKTTGGLDPSMLANFVGLLSEATHQGGSSRNSQDGINVAEILSFATSAFKQSGITAENLMDYFPQIVDTINAFVGPEARMREASHADHAWMMPPAVERLHILFDHFAHSELGKGLWRLIGLEKFFTKFSKDGKFDFNKFFDMLENQNFRRHWIKLWTQKITDIVAVIGDPRMHKKYLETGIQMLNGFLKTAAFPKAAYIDLKRPSETITAAVNFFFKRYLNMKIDSSAYVAPSVKYLEEVVSLAHERGLLQKEGIDSQALSNKLTDTINLEVIEPLARVFRAYRFAKRVPECDKYVMCLVNQEDPNEKLSLPGLKKALIKSASMYVSWFLSGKTGTSFWSLYSNIMDEPDCSIRFVEKCNDFHIEEIKVTKEYVHNEL